MINGEIFYIKDKQIFKKHNGTLRLVGKPIDIAKKAKEKGIQLLHMIDLDAQKGMRINFDVYDKLTYFINIEIEGVSDEEFIDRLLGINARVVFTLPTKLELMKWKNKNRLLVGKISANSKAFTDIELGGIDDVHDVILENVDDRLLKLLKGKRIIVYERDLEKIKNKKMIFAVLNE